MTAGISDKNLILEMQCALLNVTTIMVQSLLSTVIRIGYRGLKKLAHLLRLNPLTRNHKSHQWLVFSTVRNFDFVNKAEKTKIKNCASVTRKSGACVTESAINVATSPKAQI